MSTNSRRDFLQKSALLMGGTAAASTLNNQVFAFFKNKIMPSDQVNIGAIGINGMGWSDLTAALKIPGVNVVALCDVDKNVLDKRMADLAKMNIDTSKIKLYNDYRQLLDQKDIDAVIIGTPDHWHALQMIHACEAGKDVYIEKPVGNSIVECRAMVAAQQRYGKMVQAGQWQRFHFTFRWFWDYAGGLMTDWGVHLLDYALLGMQVDTPKSIVTVGGKFAKPDSADEAPDTLMALYEFDKFNIIWDHAVGIGNGDYNRTHGIAFIGNNGTLVLNRDGWEVIEEKKNANKVVIPFAKQVDNGLNKHMENFISVIKSKKAEDLHCPIQAGAAIASLSQMGNIAYRSQQKLFWNKQTNQFTDNAINKKYLMANYHNGYKLPNI